MFMKVPDDRESPDYNGNQVERSFCFRRPSETSIPVFRAPRTPVTWKMIDLIEDQMLAL